MRQSLQNLIHNTIIYRYDLPNNTLGIVQTSHSTTNDKCFSIANDENLSEIIYNSIIEYAFDEFEISRGELDSLMTTAIRTKMRYSPADNIETKTKYGFFGEVILYCTLVEMFNAHPIISRGQFFNILERGEPKGYDSYHLIEINNNVELWFGEAKFHANYKQGINDVFKNINKALSNKYLEDNILAINSRKHALNVLGSNIEPILNAWESNPNIVISDELARFNMRLVYPILILYQKNLEDGYDLNIQKVVEHINSKIKEEPSLSLEYSLFFIFIPVKTAKEIKQRVIEWIDSKKPLML